MTTTELDDLARAGGRDPEGLGALLEACRPALLLHVRQFDLPAADAHTAEEIVQDAFGEALGRLAGTHFPDFIRFRAWVREFVVNACRDWLRRRYRAKRDPRRVAPAGDVADPVGGVADGAAGPDRLARRREREDRLHAAMATLVDRYRRVLVLRYLEGFTAAETANLLGFTEGTVRTICVEAKGALRAALGSPEDILSSRA